MHRLCIVYLPSIQVVKAAVKMTCGLRITIDSALNRAVAEWMALFDDAILANSTQDRWHTMCISSSSRWKALGEKKSTEIKKCGIVALV